MWTVLQACMGDSHYRRVLDPGMWDPMGRTLRTLPGTDCRGKQGAQSEEAAAGWAKGLLSRREN